MKIAVFLLGGIFNAIAAFTHGPVVFGWAVPDGLSGMFAVICVWAAVYGDD